MRRIGMWRSFGGYRLYSPTDVANGPDGTLLVSDREGSRVFMIGEDGKLLATVGGQGQAPGEFRMPFGVCSDPKGRVYVADSGNDRIQVFDGKLKYLRSFTPKMIAPEGIVSDGKDGFWLSAGEFSGGDLPLVHLDANGEMTSVAGPPFQGLPSRDASGSIWVVDRSNDNKPIMRFDSRGNLMRRIGDATLAVEKVAATDGFVFGGDRQKGNLLIYDEKGRKVTNETPNVPKTPRCSAPYGIAVDREGCLWMTFLDSGIVARYRIFREDAPFWKRRI